MTFEKLLLELFTHDDLINLRIIDEQKKKAVDRFHFEAALISVVKSQRESFAKELRFPCIGINPRNRPSKKVSIYKNIVVDIDNAPLPAWAHDRADIICSRDDKHHHLYFCFEPLEPNDKNRKLYSDTVKVLLKLTGSKEKAAHDPERVIRLPGFSHGKTGKPAPGYEIKFIRNDIERLPFKEKFSWLKSEQLSKDIATAITPDPEKFSFDRQTEPPKPDEKSHANAIQYLKNLYLKKPALAAGDGRSRELFFIGLDAHAWGIPQADAERLAEEINQKKFSPVEPNDVVLHQISSAYRYRKGEFGSLLSAARGQTERQQVRARLQFETLQRARDLLADFVYVHGAERLINQTTRFELTTVTQINNYIVSRLGEKITLEELLKGSAVTVADTLDFAPGCDTMFEKEGRTVFNRYTPGSEPERVAKGEKKAVKAFREHIAYLTTSEAEEKCLLEFFAFIVQNPGKKLAWAPLIISQYTGIGKSALAELIANLVGPHNVGYAESDDLTGQHTDYVAEKIMVIAHEVETADKNVMRRLKSLITEPRVRVIAKYARTYETSNSANFLFFSNRVDAIRIDDNDRRLFVIYNRREPKGQDYYDGLFNAFKDGAGWIYDYLLSVDLSGFNPHARPIKTEGRNLLTRASMSELDTYLNEIAQAVEGPFGREVFALKDVITYLSFNAPESARRYATQRAVSYWLDAHGWRAYDYHDTVDGVRKHLSAWFKGTREAFETARRKIKQSEAKG